MVKPKPSKELEVFMDTDFGSNKDPKAPEKDRQTAKSRYEYIVTYERCPVLWKSQM